MSLGFPHPDYLLKTLSATQLQEWQEYARDYGLIRRNDYFWTQLLSMFYYAHGGKEKPNFNPYPPREEYPDISYEEFKASIFGRLPLDTANGSH